MTSPNLPKLSPEMKMKLNNGVYEIEPPRIVEYDFPMNDKTVPALQLKCNSLYVKRPNELHCCNSVVATIVGKGKGDQTELVECGKCRTSYIIRKIYHDDGTLEIKTLVWDIGRKSQQFCHLKRDDEYRCWVEFNKK